MTRPVGASLPPSVFLQQDVRVLDYGQLAYGEAGWWFRIDRSDRRTISEVRYPKGIYGDES